MGLLNTTTTQFCVITFNSIWIVVITQLFHFFWIHVIKRDSIITKPAYCLNMADFDKMRQFLVNSFEQSCFNDDDDDNVDMIFVTKV